MSRITFSDGACSRRSYSEEKIVHEVRKAISRSRRFRTNPNPFGGGHASEPLMSEVIYSQGNFPSGLL